MNQTILIVLVLAGAAVAVAYMLRPARPPATTLDVVRAIGDVLS